MSKSKESSKESSMTSLVKNYLEKTNRPYSATDVFNNLNTKDNKLSKTAVSKALDDLSAKQLIKEKLNGKQKIYFADQNNFDGIDVNKIQQIDQQLDQLTKQLEDIQNEVKHKESKLSSHKRCLTSQQLDQQLNQIKKEVNHLENKMQNIDKREKDLDPNLNQKVKNERQNLVKEWNKRKRIAVNMIDMILESYPKPKKALIEEIGVETDEEMAIVLPKI